MLRRLYSSLIELRRPLEELLLTERLTGAVASVLLFLLMVSHCGSIGDDIIPLDPGRGPERDPGRDMIKAQNRYVNSAIRALRGSLPDYRCEYIEIGNRSEMKA